MNTTSNEKRDTSKFWMLTGTLLLVLFFVIFISWHFLIARVFWTWSYKNAKDDTERVTALEYLKDRGSSADIVYFADYLMNRSDDTSKKVHTLLAYFCLRVYGNPVKRIVHADVPWPIDIEIDVEESKHGGGFNSWIIIRNRGNPHGILYEKLLSVSY